MKNHVLCTLALSLTTLAHAGIVDYASLKPRDSGLAIIGNEPALPDLELDHRSLKDDFTLFSTEALFWNEGYSDLAAVAYSARTGGILEITLTPLGFSHIRLNSFYLGSFLGVERPVAVLRVTDGNDNILWSDEPHVYAANPMAELIHVNVSATSLKLLVGNDWNLGVNLLNYITPPSIRPPCQSPPRSPLPSAAPRCS